MLVGAGIHRTAEQITWVPAKSPLEVPAHHEIFLPLLVDRSSGASEAGYEFRGRWEVSLGMDIVHQPRDAQMHVIKVGSKPLTILGGQMLSMLYRTIRVVLPTDGILMLPIPSKVTGQNVLDWLWRELGISWLDLSAGMVN